jgi:hypothetical protein
LYKRNKIEIKYYQPGFLITRFLTSLSGEAPANTTNTREEIGGKTTTDGGIIVTTSNFSFSSLRSNRAESDYLRYPARYPFSL